MLKPPRMKIQRLTQAWTTPISTGIFTALQTKNVPWAELNIDTLLNHQYYINRSGKKIVSPLIENYTDNTDNLTSEEKSEIADIVFNIFSDKWNKLYELLSLEYNPIHNYDMTETEEIEGTNATETTHTGTDTTQGTGTDTITHTGTQSDNNTGTQATAHTGTITESISENSEGSTDGTSASTIYGFNSSSAVNESGATTGTDVEASKSGTNQTTHNNTDTRTDNLTHQRTDNLTDTETRNTTDTTTHNTTDATEGENATSRTLTRSGNIGVTTTQQMILSSIDLYQWNFFNQVFEDIDTILTIKTY